MKSRFAKGRETRGRCTGTSFCIHSLFSLSLSFLHLFPPLHAPLLLLTTHSNSFHQADQTHPLSTLTNSRTLRKFRLSKLRLSIIEPTSTMIHSLVALGLALPAIVTSQKAGTFEVVGESGSSFFFAFFLSMKVELTRTRYRGICSTTLSGMHISTDRGRNPLADCSLIHILSSFPSSALFHASSISHKQYKNKVYIIDKTENNPAQVAGHPAWAVSYDIETNDYRPQDVISNAFCAGGTVLGNGSYLNVGGNAAVQANGVGVAADSNENVYG